MTDTPTTAASENLSARTGRVDPHRRERIARAAMEVVATHGVEGLTHRRVAAAAGVPLGSTTYHFATLDDLLAAGLEAAAEEGVTMIQAWGDTIAERGLVEASVDLIIGGTPSQRERSRVRYELYLAAVRRPRLRSISTEWSGQLARVYQRYTDETTAEALAAAVDGLWMSGLVRDDPLPEDGVERVLRRIIYPGEPADSHAAD